MPPDASPRAVREALEEAKARDARLAELCHIHWSTIYFRLRRWRFNKEDAQDLTQGFFAHLITTDSLARAAPQLGDFPAYLFGALTYFVADTLDRGRAEKRGGGVIHCSFDELSWSDMEEEAACWVAWHPEHTLDREWASRTALIALERLTKETESNGKGALFASLKPYLLGCSGEAIPYGEIAIKLDRRINTLWSDMARFRDRYAEILREEVRNGVAHESDVDGEMRYLCRLLADCLA